MSVTNIHPNCTVYLNLYWSDFFLWSDGICARIYKKGERLDGFPQYWCYHNSIWVFALWQYAEFFTKNGASYVCLYHHVKTKELCGNIVKAARTKANPHDLSGELTSRSVIPTDDTDDSSPLHEKPVPLEVAETSTFKKYAWESWLAVVQGKTRIYSLAVVGFYEKADACSMFSPKLYVLIALTRQTMKADHCWHFLWKIQIYERFKWKGYCGCQVHCPKWKFLVFPLAVPRNPSCASWYTITTFREFFHDWQWLPRNVTSWLCHLHIFADAVHTQCGWHFVDQGWRKIVKAWVIGEGRMMLLRGR